MEKVCEKEQKLREEVELLSRRNVVKHDNLQESAFQKNGEVEYTDVDSSSVHSNMDISSANHMRIVSERKKADAAWETHQKKSDMTYLLRDKAELETKCEVMKSQLQKAQDELAAANEEKRRLAALIKEAAKTGDLSQLSHQDVLKYVERKTSPLQKLRRKNIFKKSSSQNKARNQNSAILVNDVETENLRLKKPTVTQDGATSVSQSVEASRHVPASSALSDDGEYHDEEYNEEV